MKTRYHGKDKGMKTCCHGNKEWKPVAMTMIMGWRPVTIAKVS